MGFMAVAFILAVFILFFFVFLRVFKFILKNANSHESHLTSSDSYSGAEPYADYDYTSDSHNSSPDS
ncbi:hypothetical protein [Hippea maritima]|uniref:Uncharacterized protein n=1 Tax=Hippea maritima (strain ATCC 700847 / DSM 10411 / MH2) TaxID=760142 RepID=F2LXI5_HIPMA|nr:hypothetical protein [Hippea maritima]AEA33171.1 hypothetical protein Hipma_0193 [Hippea maritima DSM 10411]